jgi:hypothetical protein
MRTFEIKGFWGFILFGLMSLVALILALTLPISFVWVAWNAFVGELFHGPMIAFWQAAILTAILAIAFKIVFQPQISFQIKRVKSPDDLDKHLRKLKEQDSSKD